MMRSPRKNILYFSLLALSLWAFGCSTAPRPAGPQMPMTPISGVGSHFATPHSMVHVVGPSETLWRISKTYNVDMKTLLQANHLDDPTKIKNGQKLLIPATYGPRPVIPLYPSKKWKYIVIHHTATHEGDAYSIDQLHHKRGFDHGLGYHFLINNGTNGKTDGQIQVGPRWIKQQNGAHCNAAGMNEMGIGVTLVGNYSERTASEDEMESLVYLVKTLQNYYRIPDQNVIRHSDVPGKNTECPGTRFPWTEFKHRLG